MRVDKITPLHGYVLIQFYPEEAFRLDHKTGLFMARDAWKKAVWRIGKVLALGEGIPSKKGNRIVPHELQVGDFVVCDHIFGDVVYDGKNVETLEVRVLSVDQITGVLEGLDEETARALDIG